MKIINAHEHHAHDKSDAGYVKRGPFYNESGVIVSRENVWTNSHVQM